MIAVFESAQMKDDFGYFGSLLESYVQYYEAFKRTFDSALTPVDTPENDVSDFELEDEDTLEDDSELNFEDDDPKGSDV